jgi:TM2 domain-containing membrane protein YozV
MAYHYVEGMDYPNSATTSSKSAVVALLLWFFLGLFSIHNFYLGRYKYGAIQFTTWICAALIIGTSPDNSSPSFLTVVGGILGLIWLLWVVVVDLIYIIKNTN